MSNDQAQKEKSAQLKFVAVSSKWFPVADRKKKNIIHSYSIQSRAKTNLKHVEIHRLHNDVYDIQKITKLFVLAHIVHRVSTDN